jgi:hypothetical protein
MKNKRLFLTIIAALSIMIGLKDTLIQLLGDNAGAITVAFIVLTYQVLVVIQARFYNTGNWLKGWSTAFIIWNICTFIPELFAVVNAWAADSSVTLSNGFMIVMTKIILISNLVITFINADWSALLNQGDQKKLS